MTSITTVTTLVSGAYTFYCIHPFIPYRFLWTTVAVPMLNYMTISRTPVEKELELEFYEIVKESHDPETGVTTRYLILKKEEPFTIINLEYDPNEPVWL